LTSPGCRSGHYQTRVYPVPESPQALGLVTQSWHRWCLTHRLVLVLVRLLGAPPTGGTHLESNGGGGGRRSGPQPALAHWRPQPMSGSGSLETSWFSISLRCGRIHRLHWSTTAAFVMGPPSHTALQNAHTNRGALIPRPTAGNRVRTTLNSRGIRIRSPRPTPLERVDFHRPSLDRLDVVAKREKSTQQMPDAPKGRSGREALSCAQVCMACPLDLDLDVIWVTRLKGGVVVRLRHKTGTSKPRRLRSLRAS
jgi:hypothetical protein